MPRLKTLEEFDFSAAPNLSPPPLRELAQGGYIDRAEPVLFIQVIADRADKATVVYDDDHRRLVALPCAIRFSGVVLELFTTFARNTSAAINTIEHILESKMPILGNLLGRERGESMPTATTASLTTRSQKEGSLATLGIAVFVLVGWLVVGSGLAQAAPWTKLANAFPGTGHAGTCLLLTDGTVMCQEFDTNHWHRLNPDNTGSYINGTWDSPKSVADMPNGTDSTNVGGLTCSPTPCTYAPRFYSSSVLPDGKVVVIGGEYDTESSTSGLVNSWTTMGFLYDPVANTWSSQLSQPFGSFTSNSNIIGGIGDAQAIVLQNGTLILACIFCTDSASFNESTLKFSFLNSTGKLDQNDEEGWTILPGGKILTVDASINNSFEIYDPTANSWTSGTTAGVNLADVGGNCNSEEVGPAVARPDGTVVNFSGNPAGQNAVYNIASGTWSHPAGVDFPVIASQQYTTADAPASLMPGGNVLVQASPACLPIGGGKFNEFNAPSHYFEWNGTTLTQVADPIGGGAASLPSYQGRMLLLPSGDVLYAAFNQNQKSPVDILQTYNNGTGPSNAWRPVITSSPSNLGLGSTYKIVGTNFNGFSQGATYGDDAQMNTNYPLVRITDSASHVFFARTHDHSRMGVELVGDTSATSTFFDVPTGLAVGAASLVVVTNGIPSLPVAVNVAAATTLTYTGPLMGDFNDPVTLSAKLTATVGGAPLAGKTVNFTNTFGGGPCSGTTDAGGTASCTVTPTVAAGTMYGGTATFTGDATDGQSSTTFNFTVTLEETKLVINGPTSTPLNTPVSVEAQLTDPDGGAPITGKLVTFDLGSGAGHPTCSGTTDLSGDATCSLTPNEAAGMYTLTATFTDGVFYQSATASIVFTVVAPPAISKTFGALAIPVGSAASLSFTILNPNAATALTGVGFTDTLPAGLVVATPNGLIGSCGGGIITAVSATHTVSLSGATIAAGATCTFAVNVLAIAGGPQLNSVTVTSINGGTGNTALASIETGDAFTVNYAANLSVGDSFVDFTNTGSDTASGTAQNICINLYAFDPAEELIACCSCSVTPNGLQSLSVLKSLVSNPLTPAIPSSIVIKAVATVSAAACNPSAVTADTLASSLKGWRATLHQNTSVAGLTYSPTETPFAGAALMASELQHITSTCGFIQSNGSGFGVCKGCTAGGLGAAPSVQ